VQASNLHNTPHHELLYTCAINSIHTISTRDTVTQRRKDLNTNDKFYLLKGERKPT